MKLNEFLEQMSVDAKIEVWDDEGHKLYQGYNGECDMRADLWELDAHQYMNGIMFIHVK